MIWVIMLIGIIGGVFLGILASRIEYGTWK